MRILQARDKELRTDCKRGFLRIHKQVVTSKIVINKRTNKVLNADNILLKKLQDSFK